MTDADVLAPKASVIIPTYNRARFLDLTLASFTTQTDRRYEIVVVDDGSTDETPHILDAYARRLPLTRVRQANAGRAAARNAGVRAAAGDVLIFCDDDRIAAPSFVAEHLAEFPEGDERKVVLGWQRGIVSVVEPGTSAEVADVLTLMARRPELFARLRNGEGWLVTPEMITTEYAITMRDFAVPEPFWHARIEPVVQTFGDDLDGFLLPWVLGVTGNLSAPRGLVLDVGAFDEAFRGWGVEDTDLHYRLHLAGARTRVRRGACNHHQLHRRPKERVWWRNLPHFMAKHDAFDVRLFVSCGIAQIDYCRVNAILREHRQLVASGSSAVAEELARVTREHAELLVRCGL